MPSRLQTADTTAMLGAAAPSLPAAGACARLIPVATAVGAPVPVVDGLMLGRANAAAAMLAPRSRQRVSLKHASFALSQHLDGGERVWVVDQSTNGTSCNGRKLDKGRRRELRGGDEISLAGEISYIFQPSSNAAAPCSVDAAAAATDDDAMGSHLTCGICHEILYKCVSGVPCLHNLCAAVSPPPPPCSRTILAPSVE
jgi:hypothetical protein